MKNRRNEKTMMDLILNFAQKDERVRAICGEKRSFAVDSHEEAWLNEEKIRYLS